MAMPNTWGQFTLFQPAVRYWLGALGLLDWNVSIEFAPLGRDDRSVQARCTTNWTQHSARIVFNTDFTPEVDGFGGEHDMERLALHEVMHIVLCDLVNVVAQERDAYTDKSDAAEHAALRRLMRVINPPATMPAFTQGA